MAGTEAASEKSPAPTAECGGNWFEYSACSTLTTARDAWRVTASTGNYALHDLNFIDNPGENYGMRNFAGDHPTVTSWGIDAAAATAGGLTVAVTWETGPGAIILGAAAGASVETGLRAWLGDDNYGRNAVRGALLGGGAGAAMKLETAIADYYGANIVSAVDRGVAAFAPGLAVPVARVLVPSIEGAGGSSLGSKMIGLGADRLRANLYFQSTTRPIRTAADEARTLLDAPPAH